MNVLQRFLALLVLGLVIGLTSASSAAAAAPPTVPGMDAMAAQMHDDIAKLTGLTGKEFEIEFMRMMIGHHESAIRSAEVVPMKTSRPELVNLAKNIVTSQKAEVANMRGWLNTWYGIANPVIDPSAGEAEMMPAMMAMNVADFEQSFLMMMSMHHQGAMEMAALAPGRATHPELLALANNIITAQQGEIRQMRDWGLAWYNFDPMPMTMPMPGTATPGTSMPGGAMPGGTTPAGATPGTSMPGMPNTGSGGMQQFSWAIPAGLAVTLLALFLAPLVARAAGASRRR